MRFLKRWLRWLVFQRFEAKRLAEGGPRYFARLDISFLVRLDHANPWCASSAVRAALARAIFYFGPNFLPFLPPGKWPPARHAYFLRQVGFGDAVAEGCGL